MWKKIVLVIIIVVVVLTVSAGAIYASQRKSNPNIEDNAQSYNAYGNYSANCAEEYCTGNTDSENVLNNGNGVCDPEECTNENCDKLNCTNEDCLNQNCNMENNRFRNNGENENQEQNNFCYQNGTKNQNNEENCLQNGQCSAQGNNRGASFGKNK